MGDSYRRTIVSLISIDGAQVIFFIYFILFMIFTTDAAVTATAAIFPSPAIPASLLTPSPELASAACQTIALVFPDTS